MTSSGPVCVAPEELCDIDCVDTQIDPLHCGGCDDPCSEVNATPSCAVGLCVLACADGFDDCDVDVSTGCEADLAADPAHCGACGTVVAEVCDGFDNSCDGTPDEGCPTGVSPEGGAYGAHEQFGNLFGGDAFDDACPAGAALVGFDGNVGGNIDRLTGQCAVMELNVNMAAAVYVYSVTAGAVTSLPTRGGNNTTPFSIACPADEFVVGLSGEAGGGGLHDLTIHCAALDVTGAPGSFAVGYGAVTTATADGSIPGAAFSDLLAAPLVVDRIRGRAGAWVDAIGLGEATVTLAGTP